MTDRATKNCDKQKKGTFPGNAGPLHVVFQHVTKSKVRSAKATRHAKTEAKNSLKFTTTWRVAFSLSRFKHVTCLLGIPLGKLRQMVKANFTTSI